MERYLFLNKFYKGLLNTILLENKKIINKSILLTFLKLRSNDRSRFLNKSSIPGHLVKRESLNALLNNELIRESDNKIGHYAITANGIWNFEKNQGIIDETSLISFINQEFFVFMESKKSLTDKEKMVLLSMIGARLFSKEAPMNLLNETVLEDWKQIFKKSHEFLKLHNIVAPTASADLSSEGKGNTHPVYYHMVRVNNLPKSTFDIFKFSDRKIQYYLDLEYESDISLEKVAHLLYLLVGKSPSFELINSLSNFCKQMAYEYALKVVDNTIYLKQKYDDLIEKALKTLISV